MNYLDISALHMVVLVLSGVSIGMLIAFEISKPRKK